MAGESGNVFRRTKVKKTTQEFPDELEAEDIISALPDSLLLHILSFLSTKEVVRTCLLSKRWQFMWTGISEVDLRDVGRSTAITRNFVDWVGRMLAMCGGLHLNKFAVSLWYEKCYASNVNFWVHFAVKNKVKDIKLKCMCDDDMYVLPQILYSYSSLKSLTVGCCVISPRGAIDWTSLKSLSIFYVEMLNCVMEKILSGCPVLEVLHLEGCFGLNCLNIRSPNLTTLTIKGGGFIDNDNDNDEEAKYFLEISAPYLRDLTISRNFHEIMFNIRNLSSVVRASFLFYVDEDWETHMTPDITNYIKQLLESLQSLKELELRPCCIEIFSMLEMKRWKLAPSLLCLTLTPCSNRGSIPGILGFLKSSPNLNTLVIRGSRVSDDEIYVTQDQVAAFLQNGDLDLVLFHLKTIKIIGFQGFVSEPMLMLLQVLLKSAKVLEKMVICAEEESIETSSTNTTSTDLAKFVLKLVALPKASPKAVVLVC